MPGVGHWECDTLIGTSNKGAVVTMVKRNIEYAVMAKVINKTSASVSSAIVDKLKTMATRVKTLTFDNGKEFEGRANIGEQLQSMVYFARPFDSWERGGNENFTVLLRQYIPKKSSISTGTDEEIRMIQNRLHKRDLERVWSSKHPQKCFINRLSALRFEHGSWI
jgi:IS30 family transposase